jgi:hypothetical protein
MGGERGDATRVHQRASTLGERRFGDRRLTTRRASRMFSRRRRHGQVLHSGLFHDANRLAFATEKTVVDDKFELAASLLE